MDEADDLAEALDRVLRLSGNDPGKGMFRHSEFQTIPLKPLERLRR